MANVKSAPKIGLRARKRLETAKRIKAAGLKLFVEKGFDATTLDDIAAAADISRRTFFYYFKSKDDILLALQATSDEAIAPAMRQLPSGRRPIDVARETMMAVCARYKTDRLLVVDRLMRASEAVQARKQSLNLRKEQVLLAALQERWPEPEREAALRLVAMVSVSAFRLSLDTFHQEGGKRALVTVLQGVFDTLEQELHTL